MAYLKDIQGLDGDALKGRRIALAVTGSIAVIETPRLCRTLMRQGADVFVVMSRAAARLVHPDVFEWSTGNPVVTRLTGKVEHIRLAGQSEGRCDAVVLAPATANTLGKLAMGIDDTPVTTLLSTALGEGLPIVAAPGMHEPMLANPAVRANLQRLDELGVRLVWPQVAEHKAKMAPLADIVEAVIAACTPQPLRGSRVLITAGPTLEFIDPIRTIGNRSSGRLGVALAREALRRGAGVTFVYGPGTADPPAGVDLRRVVTTEEMAAAVQQALPLVDIAIFAAAVADYRPAETAADKLPTAAGPQTLALVPTPKILDAARRLNPKAYVVGFKAETQDVVEAARRQLGRSDLVVANDASNFGSAEGIVYLVDALDVETLGPARKETLAAGIWDGIIRRCPPPSPSSQAPGTRPARP